MFDIGKKIHKDYINKRITKWFVYINAKRELKWLNVEKKQRKRKKLKKEEEDSLNLF